MKDISATSFDFQITVIAKSHEKPILVDFWAPWCGPCRMLSPILEQLAQEQRELWELVKVNTEDQEDLAAQFQVITIPTIKLFYKGEAIAELMGAYPRTVVERWLQEFLPLESEVVVIQAPNSK